MHARMSPDMYSALFMRRHLPMSPVRRPRRTVRSAWTVRLLVPRHKTDAVPLHVACFTSNSRRARV
jgi:hypothetical protein